MVVETEEKEISNQETQNINKIFNEPQCESEDKSETGSSDSSDDNDHPNAAASMMSHSRFLQFEQLRNSMIIDKQKMKEAKNLQGRKKNVEFDYINDEEVKLSMDVYQLTIAANLTKTCSPVALMFCLRQCFLCFII